MTNEHAKQGFSRGDAPIVFPDAEALGPTQEFLGMCERAGIAFEAGEVDRLGKYLGLLIVGNGVANLTAVKDPSQAWVRHVFDSLTLLAPLAEARPDSRVLDLGSGAGLPGIPLAVCLPSMSFTLLDATAKKCAFLRSCVEKLGLSNVEVVHARAEQAAQHKPVDGAPSLRESFGIVTARAVGRLVTLCELVVPYVEPGGHALLTKGEKADEELAEAEFALRELKAVHAGTIPTPTGRIVVLEKRSRTPRVYPRRDGEPKNRPLLDPGS